MNRNLAQLNRWLVVFVYSVAMAWVEAAVVYYLRTHVDRLEPYQANPLPIAEGLGQAELVRELATLIMLLTVGILAGRTWRARLGYAAITFGLWDIFYYVFLKVMCNWPRTLGDWDILFLLPLPWWGPVWAPVSIALLLVIWGTLAAQADYVEGARLNDWKCVALSFVGMFVALYVFMADSLRVADQGPEAIRQVLPTHFQWPLFLLALALMAAPVVQLGWFRLKGVQYAAGR
jgi:hypothetical protein